jgi:hypothetical protein
MVCSRRASAFITTIDSLLSFISGTIWAHKLTFEITLQIQVRATRNTLMVKLGRLSPAFWLYISPHPANGLGISVEFGKVSLQITFERVCVLGNHSAMSLVLPGALGGRPILPMKLTVLCSKDASTEKGRQPEASGYHQ